MLKEKYNPKDFEDELYQRWEEKGYFKPSMDKTKENYCIMMPPPNVTGKLHMGHALDGTIQDILIRFKRMQGYNTLWLPGSDHASISTEMKVVQKLKEEGNNIYIITARYEQDGIESVEGLTEEWLKKNKIEYDRLLINSSDKLKIAREYNIDVFIDDCFKFCKEINDAGIKSYMFVGTTNNNIETGEVEKVYSWPQVYFKIKEFTKKTQ